MHTANSATTSSRTTTTKTMKCSRWTQRDTKCTAFISFDYFLSLNIISFKSFSLTFCDWQPVNVCVRDAHSPLLPFCAVKRDRSCCLVETLLKYAAVGFSLLARIQTKTSTPIEFRDPQGRTNANDYDDDDNNKRQRWAICE